MPGRSIITIAIACMLAGSMPSRVSATAENLQQVSFSEHAVELIPPPQPDGFEATRIFSDWGIELHSESGSRPISGTRMVPVENVRLEERVILNGAPGESAGALVIAFERAVRVVGVVPGAEVRTDATLRYFDADGLLLHAEVVPVAGEYAFLRQHRFEDGEGREISRVEIEYENPVEPETLFELDVDFVESPVFRSCVAQVAHGAVPGTDRTLQTQLSMTNSADYGAFSTPDTLVRLELIDSSGGPSTILLGEQQTNPIEFRIYAPLSVVVRTVSAGSDPGRGYACATAKYPIELGAIYRILDSEGRPISESGIQGTTPGYRFFGLFQKKRSEATDTGLAVANLSDEAAAIAITFHAVTIFEQTTWTLEPGEQRAKFLGEIVEEFSDQQVGGTIEVVSDQPIVATLLRTIDGVVSASLPLGRSPAPGLK